MARAKKNAGPRCTFVFLDESGFSEAPAVRRTWAPRGCTPVLRPKHRSWKRVSAIGALAYSRRADSGRVLVVFKRGEVDADDTVSFLRHMRRHLRGRVVLLWDGLAAHRSAKVRRWIDRHPSVTVERLPAYAPELNPVEGLWSWTKGSLLANVCEDTLDPILARVRRGMRSARRRPTLLRGFLAKAGLSF